MRQWVFIFLIFRVLLTTPLRSTLIIVTGISLLLLLLALVVLPPSALLATHFLKLLLKVFFLALLDFLLNFMLMILPFRFAKQCLSCLLIHYGF